MHALVPQPLALAVLAASWLTYAASAADLDFAMKTLEGEEVTLAEQYAGKVLLIVNVASECGLTPQYAQLQSLHEKYFDQGLRVLGFPCNQFGAQEPGTAAQIRQFCSVNYGVTFDMFARIEVNGAGAAPLYQRLTSRDTKPIGAGPITWNFEKFVVGRDGQVVARFAPRTRPDHPVLVATLEAELAKQAPESADGA